jgi:hypothetical protein
MLVRDGTHAGEGQAGRGVSHRTEREGRGLAEVIENPILNSPYRESTRHFHFDDDGITSTIVEGRRESSAHGRQLPSEAREGRRR